MLIRSQNKETLLNMDRVTTVELGANGLKITADTDDTVYVLGDYSSKSKAIRVLDMVQKAFADEKLVQYTAMAQRKYLDEMDEFSILQMRDGLMEKAVFQMPQDEDVQTRKEILLKKLEVIEDMDVIKNTIRTLKKHYDFLKQAWKPYPDPNVLDAIRIAISALEKQMPKKPNLEGDGYANGKLVYDTWICPGCEKEYEMDYDEHKYCPECGQAIDWSEYVAEEAEEE